jgi:phytanoyl-CoA hydroxylase
MALTKEQVEQFFEQGFLICDAFMSEPELTDLEQAFDQTFDRLVRENAVQNVQSGEATDDEAHVYQLRTAHLLHEAFDRYIHDERLLGIVESLIGPDIQLIHYQGLYKPPVSGGVVDWHQDNHYWQVDDPSANVTCWIGLDDVTTENGCMWYIPGGHREALHHRRNWDPAEKKGFYFSIDDERLIPANAIPIELKRGQVTFHHSLMPHRSLENRSRRPRRGIAAHFLDPHHEPQFPLFREMAAETKPMLRVKGKAVRT